MPSRRTGRKVQGGAMIDDAGWEYVFEPDKWYKDENGEFFRVDKVDVLAYGTAYYGCTLYAKGFDKEYARKCTELNAAEVIFAEALLLGVGIEAAPPQVAKTLEEHNQDWRNKPYSAISAGVACDACQAEMFFSDDTITAGNGESKRKVHCPSCKYTGIMIVSG